MLYVVIFLILILIANYCIIEEKNISFEFFKCKKIIIFVLVFGVSISVFAVSAKSNNGETVKIKNIPSNIVGKTEIKDITYNKVIVVGDSRMENISYKGDSVEIPINFVFDAKGRATIDWFKSTGVVKLRELLNNRNDKYHYHVVINMGVNDIQYADDIKERVKEYFEFYKDLYLTYSDVDFYILSVNPVDEEILSKDKNSRRTNDRIEEFNHYIVDSIAKSKVNNISYCNSYDKIDFNLPDGLHYDDETDQKIVKFIASKCVNYK